jgi:hypothetical protein
MENKTNFIKPLYEIAQEYGKTSYELLKLKALNKVAEVLSTIVSRSLVVFSLFMFSVVANIGVALWLSDLLGKPYYGFFCLAGFYAVIGGVLYFFMHNSIKRKVSDSLILKVLN